MLQLLQRCTEPALLAESAHNLASAVGMFGLIALSVAARSFEHALQMGPPMSRGWPLRCEPRPRQQSRRSIF
jgi:HPt (histidine-containing phosphotransfer) domain-containing protein